MLKTTFAGLRAHVPRLMLSALAVVLGVAFVTGTFTLTATIKAGFFDRFAAQARNVDVAVEPPARAGKERPTVARPALDAVRRLPGVASAEGRLSGTAAVLDGAGKVIGGAPGTAIDVPVDPRFRDFTVISGRVPATPSEALLDKDTAAREHLGTGDTVTAAGPRQVRVTLRISGVMDLGVNKRLEGSGAPVIALPSAAAETLTGAAGYDRIDIGAAGGVGPGALAARVRAAVGPRVRVVTGARLARDLADSVTHQADLLLEGLLIFGLVALLVAALVIENTFKILTAQRMRELALLRCVGATRRQVFGGVLAEAFVVGLAGSAAGVVAGLGLALGAERVMDALGAGFPSASLTVSPGVAALGLAAGTGVTMAAALLPAVLATRIPPVAALRAQAEDGTGDVRRRWVRIAVAVVLAGAGVAIAAAGVPRGRDGLLTVAAGGCVFFLATLIAGPFLVGALTAVLGRPLLSLGGVPARLAVAGVRRNPRRTATTMIALTIGVGLMTLFSVVLATAGRFADDQMDAHYPADYVISPTGDSATIPSWVAPRLRGLPEIEAVAEMRADGRGRIAGGGVDVAAADPSAYRSIYRPRLASGTLDGLGDGRIALYRPLARALGARVGESVTLTAPRGDARTFTVAAIFTSRFAGEQALVSWADFTRCFGPGGDDTVGVRVRHGVTPARSRAAIDRVVASLPLARVDSIASYKAQLNTAIDQMTAMLAALLATAVMIALFGVANTLSLSVLERTRESALLRALGLTRRQLRRTVSVEAVLIGLMGGLVGVALGSAFGWAASEAFLHDSGGGTVVFPVARILGYLAVAALAGLLAAVVPARRAARMPVIEGLAAG